MIKQINEQIGHSLSFLNLEYIIWISKVVIYCVKTEKKEIHLSYLLVYPSPSNKKVKYAKPSCLFL